MYQWGVALSDLARACKQRSAAEARACLHLASQKFAVALAADPSNVQAMNNWGLVLQARGNIKKSACVPGDGSAGKGWERASD